MFEESSYDNMTQALLEPSVLDLQVAIFCDEFDRQSRIFRSNRADLARSASVAMSVNRRAIEGEVDAAMLVARSPDMGDVGVATRTLVFFSAWLARRGGWE